MEETEKQKLLARAQALEKRQMFVKAAEIYAALSMGEAAAAAYESGGAFEKAESLFLKAKREEDARRCRKKLEESSSGKSWLDLQADFQKDSGNPY